MITERGKNAFTPINITLESAHEADVLYILLNARGMYTEPIFNDEKNDCVLSMDTHKEFMAAKHRMWTSLVDIRKPGRKATP